MKTYRILVAGAGIGGLTTASCLAKAGHHVEVYEQAPQLVEIGAGIQISANAMHVLRSLDMERAIIDVGVSPGAYAFRLHDTGEVIQRFSLSEEHLRLHGAPYTQLHRADLHERVDEPVDDLPAATTVANMQIASGQRREDMSSAGPTAPARPQPDRPWRARPR